MENESILDLLRKQNQILEGQAQTLKELKEAINTVGQKSSAPSSKPIQQFSSPSYRYSLSSTNTAYHSNSSVER
jgi:hypothetical protein